MGYTFLGLNKSALTFVGDGPIHPSGKTRKIIFLVNTILYLIVGSVGVCFLHTNNIGLGESVGGFVAVMLGCLVTGLELIAFLYNIKQFVQNVSGNFRLKVQGTKSKISQFKWRKVVNPTMANENDNFIHVHTRYSRYVLEPYYATSIINNKDGVMVFAEDTKVAKLFEKPSVADGESCTYCDTDESGCFLFFSDCNFAYKAFSVQLNVFMFCSCQLVSYFFPPEWHSEEDLLVPTCILTLQVILSLLSTILTFLNTENAKFCFFFCNFDLHYRHRGSYTKALSHHVREAYTSQSTDTHLTEDTSNTIPIVQPKYNRVHMVVSGVNTQEQELLQTLLEDAHSQLYNKAFPESSPPSSTLSSAQLNYLDEFYQEEYKNGS
eukprot:GFUD01013350.1.p1 GENE.GFUD01013350.1~~GFUD01013350.1.p1  ORF type:complete len:379 (-),score=62.44 GFUD01013350.1:152-1288(-)